MDIAQNRKAYFDYSVLDEFEAGIVLEGTEVKSLREGHCSLQEAFIKIFGEEAFLIACTIPRYSHGNIHNHEERRDRKLLLHKKELLKLKSFIDIKGMTLIPLKMYWKGGKAKVLIGCCKGKKAWDKRAAIKEREEKRSINRNSDM